MPVGRLVKVVSSVALAVALAVAMAGCASTDDFSVQKVTSIGYQEPDVTALAEGYRRIDGSTLIEAAEGVQASMRSAGLANAKVIGDGSYVSASTRAPVTVSCGDVLVHGENSTSKIPANSTVAVVPVPGDSDGDFLQRRFDVKTEYLVHIGTVVGEESAYAARVLGDHGFKVKTLDLTGRRALQTASGEFDYGGQAVGSEAVTCTSSDILERIIWN